ncbi:unnamed protein product [Musa acuminata var. zebrina]
MKCPSETWSSGLVGLGVCERWVIWYATGIDSFEGRGAGRCDICGTLVSILGMCLRCKSFMSFLRGIVPWTSFISGIVQCKHPEEAMNG